MIIRLDQITKQAEWEMYEFQSMHYINILRQCSILVTGTGTCVPSEGIGHKAIIYGDNHVGTFLSFVYCILYNSDLFWNHKW